jgi:hypothetical protein
MLSRPWVCWTVGIAKISLTTARSPAFDAGRYKERNTVERCRPAGGSSLLQVRVRRVQAYPDQLGMDPDVMKERASAPSSHLQKNNGSSRFRSSQA